MSLWPFGAQQSDTDRLASVVRTYAESTCARCTISKQNLAFDEETLYEVCDAFSRDSSQKLLDVAENVALADDRRAAFQRMCASLFPAEQAITWPRFVSFVAACAVLARYCALREELLESVDEVLEMQDTYIKKNLRQWIEQNEGLVSL